MAVTVNDEVVAVSEVVLVADVSVAVVKVEVLPACHWKYACKASKDERRMVMPDSISPLCSMPTCGPRGKTDKQVVA